MNMKLPSILLLLPLSLFCAVWQFDIDRLGNADKAVTLLYLDGLSQAEMADILGISEAAVGMRVMRIKRRLQTLNTEDL